MPDGTHRYHVITALGDTAIEGAGDYPGATRDQLHAQGRWYGYPEGNADTGIVSVSRASFPALASYAGDARSLSVRVGCTQRGSPCGAGPDANIANNVRGAEIDVIDATPPRDLTVDASGLLQGGDRAGSDPVRVKVTDPSGIRKIELFDVTGTPQLVGVEDYFTDVSGVQTDRGASCSFRLAAPCPQLNYGEYVRATSLQTGPRKLLVRATDTGGNAVDRGPYDVNVSTPSNRGALNGAGATEGGKVTAQFTTGTSKTRRTIGFLSKADVAGQPAQRRRAADHRRQGRRAHPRPRRRRRQAAHLRHDRLAGPLQVPGDRLRVAPLPVRLGVARQRRPLRRQRLRDAARAGVGDAEVEPRHDPRRAPDQALRAPRRQAARVATSTSSRRAASARRGAGARSPTARSGARA